MNTKSLLLVLTLGVLGACTNVSQGGYYWGAYSPTYFEMVKNPSEEASSRRLEALTDIIDTSLEKGLRVPPGVYAERAMMYLEKDEALAMADFQAEIQSYPEAQPFIERIVSRYTNQ